MKYIDAKQFKKIMGREPIEDDLDRVNCLHPGELGHHYCGWCTECNRPKFACTCPLK